MDDTMGGEGGGLRVLHRLQEQPWTFVTALVCALIGPWHAWMGVLLVLIMTDYASGFLKGCVTGTCDSDIAKRGIYKKLGMGLAVVLAHQFDIFIGAGDVWVKTVLALLIASETWSVIENLDDVGVPMPQALKDKVNALRNNNPRRRRRNEDSGQDQGATTTPNQGVQDQGPGED